MKCLTALWLSIAFSDTDLILQFCLSYNKKDANVLFYEDTLRCYDLPSPANRATGNDIIIHLTHGEDMTWISEPYHGAGRQFISHFYTECQNESNKKQLSVW